MKKKKIIRLGVILAVIWAIVFLISFTIRTFKPQYKKNSYEVLVEIQDDDDSKERKITFDVKDDGQNAVVNTSLISNPIYITDKGVIFEKDGRYKLIKSENSYRDIYKTIDKLEVSRKDGNYHPTMSKDGINELLRGLFIDYEHNEDSVCNVTIKDGNIKEFSLYLRDFHGYSKVGIIITKEYIESSYTVKMPIFYSKVTDEVEERELRFLK